jgi:nucleotide-binding universal stress UspA family protein
MTRALAARSVTLMFKNVLVGVDGRPTGRDAIALAAALTDPAGKLTLANVRNDVLSPLHAAVPGAIASERAASHDLLERERDNADIGAELISIVSLSPGAGLHKQAEEQGADLLVVGSCSHGAIGRAMLGDDTRAALNGAPCAVAIAARGYAEHPTPLANVGVGYNDSPESKAAVTVARMVAAPTKARLHALEVLPITVYSGFGFAPSVVGEDMDKLLEGADARLRELSEVDGRATFGLAGEELAAFGDELDLLVVGSRGYGPMRRLVLGSTSTYLERHARCSLLVLPRLATSPDVEAQWAEGDDRPSLSHPA